MHKRYQLRKIYTLLVQSFTEEELREFCRQTSGFDPVYNQLTPYSDKDEIIRQIFEHARQTTQFLYYFSLGYPLCLP